MDPNDKPSDQPDDQSRHVKGKGKEPESEPESMAERLRASANMVTGAMTSGPQDTSGLSLGEKGASATSHGGVGGSSGVLHETAQSRLSQGQAGSQPGSFKSHQNIAESQPAFDNFMSGQGLEPFEEQQSHQPAAQPMFPGNAVAFSEAQDGSAVVDLLSQAHDLDMEPTQDDRDDTLSPEEATKLRDALFGPASRTAGRNWDRLLDFTPQFLESPEGGVAESMLHLGHADQKTARDVWLGQWREVLSSYNDEVWGDLGALVEQAKQEVEESLDFGNPDLGQGALGRLKMILAHVRGPG